MGIPKFFGRFILGKYKDEVASNTLPSTGGEYIANVEFDLGGILHHTAEIIYSYGDGYNKYRTREVTNIMSSTDGSIKLVKEFCIAVTDEIEKIIKAFIEEVNSKYKKIGNLVIAMDGVAPFAKIIQQRTRRYRTTMKNEETRGPNIAPHPSWDSNSITPGTDFVDMFDRHIRGWIMEDNIKSLVYNKIIFSSYRKRGEGEHKLFGFRRQGLYEFEEEIKIDDTPITICYGSDADLILLNLGNETDNVYIVRDKDKKVNTRKGALNGTEIHGVVINVDKLKEIIVDEMTDRSTKNTMLRSTYYSILRDFILMTLFLGNDFLPKVFCFADLPVALSEFMTIYSYYIFNTLKEKDGEYVLARKSKGDITSDNGFLCREDGGINWEVLLIFMEKITELEPEYLKILGSRQKRESKGENTKENNSQSLDTAITMKNAVSERSGNVKTSYTLDLVKFRNKWYNLVLGPKTSQMKKFLSKHNINYVSEESSIEMYKQYLTGLQWILLYYVRGTENVNKFWSYTYTQSPMMEDIYHYTKVMVESGRNIRVSDLLNKPTDPNFGPIHQLLSVMPPKSKDLIPKLYRDLLLKTNPLSYIAPYKFNVDYESATAEHEGLTILPIVDPLEIIRLVNITSKKKKIGKHISGEEELDTIIVRGIREGGMKYTEEEKRKLRKKGYELIKKMESDNPKKQTRKPYKENIGSQENERSRSKSRKPYKKNIDSQENERFRNKSRKPYKKGELNTKVEF